MRRAAAAALAVVALGGAIYFGSLRLETHGNYPACQHSWAWNCGPASRGHWQFAVAILIVLLGLAAAFSVLEPADREPIHRAGARAGAGAGRVLAVGLVVGVVGIVIGVIVGVITAPPSDPYDLGGDPHGVWILASALFGGGIGFAVGCLARVAWLVWQSVRSRTLRHDQEQTLAS